jgi:hypothetical protein
MFTSLLFGALLGIISWILTSVIYYGGFDIDKSGKHYNTFYKKSLPILSFSFLEGKLISMLVGNVFSIGTGGILVVVLTLITTKPLNVDQIGEVWEKTRDIDSPLLPWTEIYAR